MHGIYPAKGLIENVKGAEVVFRFGGFPDLEQQGPQLLADVSDTPVVSGIKVIVEVAVLQQRDEIVDLGKDTVEAIKVWFGKVAVEKMAEKFV